MHFAFGVAEIGKWLNLTKVVWCMQHQHLTASQWLSNGASWARLWNTLTKCHIAYRRMVQRQKICHLREFHGLSSALPKKIKLFIFSLHFVEEKLWNSEVWCWRFLRELECAKCSLLLPNHIIFSSQVHCKDYYVVKYVELCAQCPKIRKKVQFQKCKKALFAFSKMAKNPFLHKKKV